MKGVFWRVGSKIMAVSSAKFQNIRDNATACVMFLAGHASHNGVSAMFGQRGGLGVGLSEQRFRNGRGDMLHGDGYVVFFLESSNFVQKTLEWTCIDV